MIISIPIPSLMFQYTNIVFVLFRISINNNYYKNLIYDCYINHMLHNYNCRAIIVVILESNKKKKVIE